MAEERRLRALLVDDEPDMLALVQAAVSTKNWEIVGRATSGEEVLRLAAQTKPDVAVVDYRMPIQNGLQVAEQLKKLQPKIFVIMFSAMFTIEDKALHSGFVDLFAHKGDLRTLRQVLNEVHSQLRPHLSDA